MIILLSSKIHLHFHENFHEIKFQLALILDFSQHMSSSHNKCLLLTTHVFFSQHMSSSHNTCLLLTTNIFFSQHMFFSINLDFF